MSSGTGICFILATCLRTSWLVGMKERARWGVFDEGAGKGLAAAVGKADGVGTPESGTPAT